MSSSAAAPVPAATAGAKSAGTLALEHWLSLFPWLLAAFALGAGGAFLLLRNRSREVLAGRPQFDSFSAPGAAPGVAPEAALDAAPEVTPQAVDAPAPQPVPKAGPAPQVKRPPPPITGIVSTRLRPWVEIGFRPLSCTVEDKQVTFEFDLELLNTGNAPARAVLVEATLFNASNSQDEELGTFFANPVGEGERIASIQPMKRMNLTTKVVTAREQVQVYEIGGRKVFVPIIAFNTLYRWSGGEGQTSSSYLLGLETKASDKMAPFRLDLGPRMFASVAARLLPTGVRD